ncbi:dihydroorotase [Selenomonadales bacterium OttesenSCG-928-I06]|nr:dihydroorotase [Selenomonadales bacterium OttesenSCG-928-I06]
MKILIKNGRVIDPSKKIDETLDILIENGQIKLLEKNINDTDAEIYDAKGLVVAPGFIDMHVHLREPGLEAKEDINTGTKSAAAGGFTTVACMPNTRPTIDSAIVVEGVIKQAETIGVVNVKVIGSLSKGLEGKELSEIGDMIQAGAVAISDDGGDSLCNTQLIRTGFEYTDMFNKVIISHAEDMYMVHDTYMHEGAVSAMLGIKGRPCVAEDIAASRDILLAEYTNAALHIAHVSSKRTVELIREAKKRGVKVTAEATPHHLTLTDENLKTFDTAFKVNPPLRSKEHVEALLEGLKDGTIDAIATDHAPHAFEEKDVEFRYAPSGFAGLETAVGVILTELYHTNKFTLNEIIEKFTVNPAKILDIKAGTLEIGSKADLTILDPDFEWTVDSNNFYTKGKASPFNDRKLKGKAVATVVGGNFVMKAGDILV